LFFTCGEDTRHITYIQINNLKIHESQEVNLCSLLGWKILDIWYTNQYHFYLQTPSGPINESSTVILTCDIEGGNPLATITWTCEGSSPINPTGSPPTNTAISSVQCVCIIDGVGVGSSEIRWLY
jgi:hypothetical protein